MAIDTLFPEWGDIGERPPEGFSYDGGDGLQADHLDYLFSSLHTLNTDIQEAFADGINATTYKGHDIDFDGDSIVNKADYALNANATTYKHNDIDQTGNGVVDTAHEVERYKQTTTFNEINLTPEDSIQHELFVPGPYWIIFDRVSLMWDGDGTVAPEGVAIYAKEVDEGDVRWYSRKRFYEPPYETLIEGPDKCRMGIENYGDESVTVSGSISYVLSDFE